MEFEIFAKRVNQNILGLAEKYEKLYKVDITKEEMWDAYIDAIPVEINGIFREKRRHECSICKNFIINMGTIVAIDENLNIHTIWEGIDDKEIKTYKIVAKKLDTFVRQKKIKEIFLTDQKKYGNKSTIELTKNGEIITWPHFWIDIPHQFITSYVDYKIAQAQETVHLLKKIIAEKEIAENAIKIIKDLIHQNAIYRGNQYKNIVEGIYNLYKVFEKMKDIEKFERFLWKNYDRLSIISHIKSMVIGELAINITKGMDIDKALNIYESRIAPENYKRTKSLITPKQIDNAKKKLQEMGLLDSIYFRDIDGSEIPLDYVIWKRHIKNYNDIDIFESIKTDIEIIKNGSKQKFGNIQEVSIEEFITDILPYTHEVELYFEPSFGKNLLSIFRCKNPDAPSILKWDNNFSWSYTGNLADSSIANKVKDEGGETNGLLRCSLSWENLDDLDIYVQEPNGKWIFYENPCSYFSGACLDTDMNAWIMYMDEWKSVRGAVENVVWTNKVPEGIYMVIVNNYHKRESNYPGFRVEIEYEGTTYLFDYPSEILEGQDVEVAKFVIRDGKIKFLESLPFVVDTISTWGIVPNTFVPVNMVLTSPNFWGEKGVGNLHYIFILPTAKRDKALMPFYNEYVKEEIYREHRKVLEVLSHRLEVKPEITQTSGIGFSSTIKKSVIVKVSGKFNKLIRIKI